MNIGLKLWEQHQFRLRELNVPVIFADKGLIADEGNTYLYT